jgi:hypothetical protein
VRPKLVVVPIREGLCGLAEHRGGDGDRDPWYGELLLDETQPWQDSRMWAVAAWVVPGATWTGT